MTGNFNKSVKVIIFIFLFLSAGPELAELFDKAVPDNDCIIGRINAAQISEAQQNFLDIKEYYAKWQMGLFGSSRAYLRKLKSHLISIIGKRIETDRSFIIESPGSVSEKKVVCKLKECRWLKLHGFVDADNLKELVEKDSRIVRKWWRSGLLFTVSGKVRKFRIGRDSFGDTVELYLEVIKIHKP